MRGQSVAALTSIWERLLHMGLGTVAALLAVLIMAAPLRADGEEKSGVAPQVISLPSGPGSLEGLGASFDPNLNTGTASYPLAFVAPPGRAGFQPTLGLTYDGGNANGPWGMGWKLDVPSIERHTDEGLPTYQDDKDRFLYSNGEKLVALSGGDYRFENEGAFMRFRRLPDGGWEAHAPDGTHLIFGASESTRKITPLGIFAWQLERQIDTHGNEVRYFYLQEGGYSYLSEIRYNFNEGGSYNAVVLKYETRPDVFTDRRSRAPITIGLRAAAIEMWAQGSIVRSYRFDYMAESSTGRHSLLHRVRQIGDDGVSELPPTTFTYTRFDPTTSSVVSMQEPPPISLTHADADLVDINADGLPDIAYTPVDGHRFYLNRGNSRWQAEPLLPDESPPDRLSSPNARMADMNGDGQVDLLVKSGSTANAPFYYYARRPGEHWEAADRIDYNLTPNFNLDDPNLRLFDANNDKRIDIMRTTANGYFIWLAHEDNSWSASADLSVPAVAVGSPLLFENSLVKLGDMTGDRIQELIFVRDGFVAYFPHNGYGDYADPISMSNPPAEIGDLARQIQVGDLNNDGLDDLVLAGNRSVRYWLNLGDNSFAGPIVLNDTPAYDQQQSSVRLADIDGDGATELLFSRYPAPEDESLVYVDFATGAQPHLLQSIDNGLGRTIHVEYRSSTAYYVEAWDAGKPWQNTLPFPVQVVSRVTIEDAHSGQKYVTELRYGDGYYDGDQKEFRGFAAAEEIVQGDSTAPTQLTRYLYDVGEADESRKGLVLESEVLGLGGSCSGSYQGCYTRQVNDLETRTLAQAGSARVAYSFVSRTDTFVHEQEAASVQLRQLFDRDEYGNLTQEFNYGQVCGADLLCGDDEILTYSEYAYNVDQWIVNLPSHIRLTDANGNFVSEMRHYYDGEAYLGLPLGQVVRGDLTRQEANVGPLDGNRFIATKRQAFDSYGNVTGIMDANGNRVTIDYDAQSHTFPVRETIHLGGSNALTYAATYHSGFGVVTSATDFNGNLTRFAYDTFGRVSHIALSGDTLELPTQRFIYSLGSPRSSITTEQRERSGSENIYTSIVYFDGLGRKVQTRSEGEGGQVVVVGALTFNLRGKESEQYLPYYAGAFDFQPPPADQAKTSLIYDPLLRIRETHNADGTTARIHYHPLAQDLYDEEDNDPDSPHYGSYTTHQFDALERLVGVLERNGELVYTTRYRYDRLGNLIRIEDTHGNVKTQSFDGLSRKLAADDPDRGLTRYRYDDAGNLLESVDAKGQTIHYAYDAANRLVSENYLSAPGDATPEVRYHYDADLSPDYPAARNTLGELAWVEDLSGAEFLSYDARGNLAARSKRLVTPEGQWDFVTRMQYDAMERLISLVYPDGTVVAYHYNVQSLLESIPNFVNNIDYLASGQYATIRTADWVTTEYRYDNRQRLTELRMLNEGGEILQAWGYTLDGVSNITGIDDLRPNRTPADDDSRIFVLDDLYRLTRAHYSGNAEEINYGYDAIGNLIEQNGNVAALNLGQMRYGQEGRGGPHALTQVGEAIWTYDANGNLMAKPGFTFGWDSLDRLVDVSAPNDIQQRHTFDYGGLRVVKRITTPSGAQLVLSPDKGVEVRGGELYKYIFAGETRVAEIRTPFVPGELIHDFEDTAGAQSGDAEISAGDAASESLLATEATGVTTLISSATTVTAEFVVWMPTVANQPTTPPLAGQSLFHHGDHLGSASVILDSQGQFVERISYYPYGLERTKQQLQAGLPVAYRFTGQELDGDIGLYDYGARFYDPLVGRFMSVDPLYFADPMRSIRDLTLPQLLNTYAYAGNNPLKFSDPTGLFPWEETGTLLIDIAAGVGTVAAGIGVVTAAAAAAPVIAVAGAVVGGALIIQGTVDIGFSAAENVPKMLGHSTPKSVPTNTVDLHVDLLQKTASLSDKTTNTIRTVAQGTSLVVGGVAGIAGMASWADGAKSLPSLISKGKTGEVMFNVGKGVIYNTTGAYTGAKDFSNSFDQTPRSTNASPPGDPANQCTVDTAPLFKTEF